MPMVFDFALPGRIHFGIGRIAELPALISEAGKRVCIITGRHPDRHQRVFEEIESAGVIWSVFRVTGEPTVQTAMEAVNFARERLCDCVVSIGGGSSIDAGKVVAAMMTNESELIDHLEVIGGGKPLLKPTAPHIAVPTTSGTGAEATKNAVLESPEHRVKVSVRSNYLLPHTALIDPALTVGVPPKITAATGLDALTQLIEAFTSRRASPMTDALCRQGIGLARTSLLRAFLHGDDLDARSDMSLASLLGGIALANAGLGAVHGFAGPFGGLFHASHGAVCAALLPHVVRANIDALRSGDDGEAGLGKYRELGRILTGEADASPEDAVRWLRDITAELYVRPLSSFRFTKNDYPVLMEKARLSSSMRGNPVGLTDEQLAGILDAAI